MEKEAGVNDRGVDPLPRKRQLIVWNKDFGTIYFGGKTCNLDVNNDDAEVRVHFLKSKQKAIYVRTFRLTLAATPVC
jgi:hypothetical protein